MMGIRRSLASHRRGGPSPPLPERVRIMRLPVLSSCLIAICALAGSASAQVAAESTEPAIPVIAVPLAPVESTTTLPATEAPTPASITPLLSDPALVLPLDGQPVATAPAPKLAFEYSEGYRQRAKIHKLASWATLPLFAAEAVVGSSLYSNPTSTKRDAHVVLGAGIGALFAVNTVTGVWNLLEARKDPSFGKKKWVHSILMMGADVGFVGTALTGPESEHGESEGSKATHRAIVFSSIAMATTAYLIMLFGD
jgi:hypothetical protein